LIAAVLLVALVMRASDPATGPLLQAVRELGPVGGWHCVEGPTYVYDPTREQPDSALIAQPPEDVVLALAPDQAIDHVDADLRGGDSRVWTHTATDEAADGPRRVYVLSPGQLQPFIVERAGQSVTLCNARLSDWRIVGEEEM
jgi:hypothetical protein